MAIYKCKICGAVYDEEKEGKPFSELTCCPVCRMPVSNMEPVPASGWEAAPKSYSGSLDYDPVTARHDPSNRYMAQIHEMAVTGKSIGGSMSTQMPMPNWDDILLLGAQLNPAPLNDGDFVTVIGGNGAGKSTIMNAIAAYGLLMRERLCWTVRTLPACLSIDAPKCWGVYSRIP